MKNNVTGSRPYQKPKLEFTIPSQKRTIFLSNQNLLGNRYNNDWSERYFLLFPNMEFSIPYKKTFDNSIRLDCPHYELNYNYNNKKYYPKLPNHVYYDRKLYYCTNFELYENIKYFEDENSLKNYIVDNFFNSIFLINSINMHVKLSTNDLKAMFKIWQTKNKLTPDLLDFISFNPKKDFNNV